MKKLLELIKREDGVTSSEYALIAALIAMVIIVAVTTLGTSVRDKFGDVATSVGNAGQ
jgi:pilus assembly protein Flp/PilA